MADLPPFGASDLPPLSDEAVVQIHDFLEQVLAAFESRYFAQIHRYYEDRSTAPDPPTAASRNPAPSDDPPF